MKTTFTRRELVHTGIKQIRSLMRIYQKDREVVLVNSATDTVNALGTLGIIRCEKQFFLQDIVDNEFERILYDGKGEWRK